MHSSTHKSEFQAPQEVFSTYYPHSLLCSISPNAPFPFPSSLFVSLFLNFFLLIRSSSSLHLSEYLHLSHLISFIFFLAHISFSFPVLLSPLSSHHIFSLLFSNPVFPLSLLSVLPPHLLFACGWVCFSYTMVMKFLLCVWLVRVLPMSIGMCKQYNYHTLRKLLYSTDTMFVTTVRAGNE